MKSMEKTDRRRGEKSRVSEDAHENDRFMTRAIVHVFLRRFIAVVI